jgi:hypothetical protein
MRKTEYKVVEVVLKPDPFGRRVTTIMEYGDVVYIDTKTQRQICNTCSMV